jgi:lipopolysaccharide/colanic/teichoic acid biosynthesis glycosyltransferase
MLSLKQQIVKRSFDVSIALFALILLIFPLILLLLISRLDLGLSGLFTQRRVGRNGKIFKMYKIRTLKGSKSHTIEEISTHQTPFGRWLRKSKLDEIPQFFNVLKGEMSLVGPRPDLPGYADQLKGDDKIILRVRPGITGPATIKYKQEDLLLKEQEDAQKYNDEVIWPDKVKINKEYIKNWSFFKDLKYIYKSVIN